MRQIRALLFTYSVVGAYAVCAQAALLRETQVLLFGSELSWGLVLAFWLAGVAIGAQVGGRFLSGQTRPLKALSASNLVMPVILTLQIMLLRGTRLILDTGPGEYVGLLDMFLVTAVATVPVSFWVGLAFPAASAMLGGRHREPVERARSVGWIYISESAGSLIGGVLYSFIFVVNLNSFELVIGGGVVLAIATACLLREWALLKTAPFTILLWAIAAATALGIGSATRLENLSVLWRWRSYAGGLELVNSRDSKFQNITVGRLGNQYSVYTNGTLAATWPDHRALAIEAHMAACQHPAPGRILVLGGGAEGLVKELLHHEPENLDFVMLDRIQLEMMRPLLDSPDREVLDSLHSHFHFADARRFVKDNRRRNDRPYDLIILAAPEPATTLEARFYTAEFFSEIERIMSVNGVLSFSMNASAGHWSPAVATYVGSVVRPLESVFPEVLLTFGDPVRIYAAKKRGVLVSTGEALAGRYRSRNVSSPYFDPIWFEGATDILDPTKMAQVRQALITQPPLHLNSDEKPAAAVYHMRMWMATTGAAHRSDFTPVEDRARFLTALLQLKIGWVAVGLIAMTLLAALTGLFRGRDALRRTALLWAVGTTGFVSMAVEIVLLYTFQVLYGYVYSMAGLIIGIFMFGLVLGSLLMNYWLRSSADRRTSSSRSRSREPGLRLVLLLDISVILFLVALMYLLAVIRVSATEWLVQLVIFTLVTASGVIGGLIFPIAASVWLGESERTGHAAGAVSASDHLGACLGAFVTGVALVPILGIGGTCLVLIIMKVLSGLLITGSLPGGSGASLPVANAV